MALGNFPCDSSENLSQLLFFFQDFLKVYALNTLLSSSVYIKLFFLSRIESQATDGKNKAKKLTLPLFGAMKGGSKFKLKTGTVGVSCRSRS